MTPFILATLEGADGGKAAIGINGSYYLPENSQPLLQPASCKRLLESWDMSLRLLEELAGSLAANSA